LMALAPPDHPEHRQILAFLRNQLGRAALQAGSNAEAADIFAQAIDTDAAVVPAYLNLGDLRAAAGDLTGAVEVWERLTRAVPERAHLVFGRLERAYASTGESGRFVAL